MAPFVKGGGPQDRGILFLNGIFISVWCQRGIFLPSRPSEVFEAMADFCAPTRQITDSCLLV